MRLFHRTNPLAVAAKRQFSMTASVYRDAERIPARATVDQFDSYLDGLRKDLLDQWKRDGTHEAYAHAALGHAPGFTTWKSLEDQGLADSQKTELIIRWLGASKRPE